MAWSEVVGQVTAGERGTYVGAEGRGIKGKGGAPHGHCRESRCPKARGGGGGGGGEREVRRSSAQSQHVELRLGA